jgi:DNA-binding NtrC family response regulator/predicted hydrocarbon binding protein
LKADDIQIEELVRFSDGALDLQGRRLILHPLHAFAHFRRELTESAGPHEARRILTRFGYYWGHADAAAMKRIFKWETTEEWLRAGIRMPALEGMARVGLKTLSLDEGAGTLEMELLWYASAEAEEHLIEFGPSKEPVCWTLAGYASGYATFCLGKDVFFIEQECRATGKRHCAAIGKTKDAWGDAVRPHLAYFGADDIHGKVLHLSMELREQANRRERQSPRVAKQTDGVAADLPVELAGASFRRVMEIAARVALYDSSVLITGESGVGKEVVAREIHRLSPRSTKAFVGVNCSALPESLLESELFGHSRGAFTGAGRDRIGLFEQSQGGTIFLDEIGDISAGMQLRLLRVLQEREITRVGESKSRVMDIRVIAATNRNLAEAIEAGRFRRDLYYRLGVIEIDVPPLRERPEDILPLARHFVRRLAAKLKIPGLKLEAACIDPLLYYRWPGNARELGNAIERAAVLSPDGIIRPEYLPAVVTKPARGSTPVQRSLMAVESEHIHNVLACVGGNRARAAAILGISQTTLWRRLKITG